ncbi:hypothetical protein BDV97DRAFT_183760 [Delphinella strobiligena]|nr:hypothetical protein BDV97DRAFT_183760 [Delphinella strobiligena]
MSQNRTPLRQINSNIRCPGTQLSPIERAYLLGCFNAGESYAEIRDATGYKTSRIRTIIQKATERSHVDTLKRSGQPCLYTLQDERRLVRYA